MSDGQGYAEWQWSELTARVDTEVKYESLWALRKFLFLRFNVCPSACECGIRGCLHVRQNLQMRQKQRGAKYSAVVSQLVFGSAIARNACDSAAKAGLTGSCTASASELEAPNINVRPQDKAPGQEARWGEATDEAETLSAFGCLIEAANLPLFLKFANAKNRYNLCWKNIKFNDYCALIKSKKTKQNYLGKFPSRFFIFSIFFLLLKCNFYYFSYVTCGP